MSNLLSELEIISGKESYIVNIYDELAHSAIGVLSNLNTEDQTNLVAAINEVISDYTDKIGSLSDLDTEDQSNLVAAINEVISNFEAENKHILTYVNALKIGVIANSAAAASDNVRIINDYLSRGYTVYLPSGIYYINAPLIIPDGAGLFSNNADHCIIQMTVANTNAIEIPVSWSPDTSYKVETCVRLENIRVYNPNGGGTGVTLYNYTYEVTCHNDGAEYIAYKGNAYGLEYRNSIFRNIQITGFNIGLRCGVGTGVFNLNEFFIDTCGTGIIDNSADATFNEFNITFCSGAGISAGTTIANKYSNFKIYQNHGNGATFYNVRNMTISNMNVEENEYIGAQFINCSGCSIDIIAASNGWNNTEGTDYDKVGVAMTGSSNMAGTIIACDKNAAYFGGTASQTYGLTIDSAYTGSFLYEDFSNVYSYNQLSDNTKANTIIGGDVGNTQFAAGANVTIDSLYANFCQYENNTIGFSVTFEATDDLVFDSIVAQCIINFPSRKKTYSVVNYTTFLTGVDTNTGTIYKFRLVDGSLHAAEAIPNGAHINVSGLKTYSTK